MRVALIDHYDSFTFNVIDWLRGPDGGVEVERVAHDDGDAMARLAEASLPLVFSPGPKRPEDAPVTLALLRKHLGRLPILGICLGHQMLAHAGGARIVRSRDPYHGTTRRIEVREGAPLLAGLAPSFEAVVYNSLVADPEGLAPAWDVDAVCALGEIQAISYTPPGAAPAFGLQFHPEAFLSQGAEVIRANWLKTLPTFCR